MVSEDTIDPEPIGLASGWPDQPPARRALEVDPGPLFQATPVRVDEAFPEYEAYHSVIEYPADTPAAAPVAENAPAWDNPPVAAPRHEGYGWVPAASDPQRQPPLAPGLAPYPMPPAPQPVAYAQAPAPIAYAQGPQPVAYAQAPQPIAYVPGPQPTPYPAPPTYTFDPATTPSPYAVDTVGSDTAVALAAVGGTFLVLRKMLAILPFVVASAIFTVVAMMFGGGSWVLAAFAWVITIVAVLGRTLDSRQLLVRLFARR